MLGHNHPVFIEAEMAYRRDRIAADYRGSSHRTRSNWLGKLKGALTGGGDPRRGASRRQLDGPLIRPGSWPGVRDPRSLGAPHHLVRLG